MDKQAIIDDLRKTFGGAVRALDGVSIDIAAGAFFTLLGPSGCGKTTLLRAIAGFEPQDSGTITLGGQPLDGLPPHRRPVNTVFQSYAVFPHMTVAENVAFALEMQKRPRAEIAARARPVIRAFSEMRGRTACPACCKSSANWVWL